MMELLTGKQQIAFAIKGKATFEFDLVFRLYQHQLRTYVETLKQEYPDADFSVNSNVLHVTLQADYLCDTIPLTTAFTSASYTHNETWIATRNVTRIVDDIYSRVLSLHIEAVALKGDRRGLEDPSQPAMGHPVLPE